MRYLSIREVLSLYEQIMATSGGTVGIRDLNGLESAVAQPKMTYGGEELYPSLTEKAAALAFSLIMNHPFTDGNKRIGHAAMETFLVLNGAEINASEQDQEQIVLGVAASEISRGEFVRWLQDHVSERRTNL